MGFLESVKPRLAQILNDNQRRIVRRHVSGRFAFAFRHNLNHLAVLFGTDKYGRHFYTPHYHRHFGSIRHRRLTVLEIGIGGYNDPRRGGESLRMWKAYFRKSQIHGLDIHDKRYHTERRITTHQASQVDGPFLRALSQNVGGFDIVIDDGSHINQHVIETFEILFPLLKPDGIYAIEDLQSSYWAELQGQHWGGSLDLSAPHTSMNYFKRLVDGLNYEEFVIPDYCPSYYDTNITSVHFYHNMVFVHKGLNREGSSKSDFTLA